MVFLASTRLCLLLGIYKQALDAFIISREPCTVQSTEVVQFSPWAVPFPPHGGQRGRWAGTGFVWSHRIVEWPTWSWAGEPEASDALSTRDLPAVTRPQCQRIETRRNFPLTFTIACTILLGGRGVLSCVSAPPGRCERRGSRWTPSCLPWSCFCAGSWPGGARWLLAAGSAAPRSSWSFPPWPFPRGRNVSVNCLVRVCQLRCLIYWTFYFTTYVKILQKGTYLVILFVLGSIWQLYSKINRWSYGMLGLVPFLEKCPKTSLG